MPHVHISGLEGLVTVLYVIAIMGALNLLVKKVLVNNPKNQLASSYAYIFGI